MMMARLLDVADVSRGDGNWMHDVEFDAYSCLLASKIDSVCSPESSDHLSGPEPDSGETYEDLSATGGDAPIFAVSTFFQSRLMCTRDETEQMVSAAIEVETEKALGKVLVDGVDGSDLFLGGSLVAKVTRTANDQQANLVRALRKLWSVAGVDASNTLVHMGVGTAFDLAAVAKKSEYFEAIAGRMVSNASYPDNFLAVTGPLKINVSNVQTIETTNVRNNRGLVLANRLASISFDPCQAVQVNASA